jgi:hypothetical protein
MKWIKDIAIKVIQTTIMLVLSSHILRHYAKLVKKEEKRAKLK